MRARTWTALAGTCVLLAVSASCGGAEPATEGAAAEMPKVYDEQADAVQQIDGAIRSARRDSKRVLLVFGGNWCGWCIKLHKLFDENDEIGSLLLNDYVVTWIDSAQLDKHEALNQTYGAKIAGAGVPYLAVLATDGEVLALQDTGSLEAGNYHDPDKVKGFLEKLAPPKVDAEKVLADAQARAASEDKAIFLQCSTPTCGWCRRLEKFLDENPAFFERDYVPVKIDIARMTNGKEVAERVGFTNNGVPWHVMLDSQGKAIIDSNGPQGNIGYPAMPEEIAHFVSMLKRTAKRNTPEQIAEIEQKLKEAAAKLAPPSQPAATPAGG